jgi:predicted extracellular nuclease
MKLIAPHVPKVVLSLGLTLLLAPAPAHAASTSLVVSQVYGGGGNAGSTYRNDFIELFNRGGVPVDLTGWSVQYASAAGTTWQVTPLSGSLAPGQYFLVQEAAGTGGTVDLPAPDASGTIAMGGTAGKVALVSSTTALTGSGCPPSASVIDFVGYGTGVSCSEGGAASPAPSNTNAVHRALAGCTDTDVNAVDFAAAAPLPRNRGAGLNSCAGGPTNPSGVGTATPSLVVAGGSTLLAVSVSPGQNPTSTGIAVAADLAAIGGPIAQPLFDDGTHGDTTAGDLVFSLSTAVGTAAGAKTLPVTISDAQARGAATVIAFTVQGPSAIVISQVYGGGGNSGATLRNDFIELFNRSNAPVDITGWSLQYTSAAGVFSASAKTDLTGLILPGQYFLVQEAAGTGGTVDLIPDAVGTIAMGATSGKVALVSSTAVLTGGGCPFAGSVVDFVGYGTGVNCFEGVAGAPAPSNTTAVRRSFGGCTDTNSNAGDFALSAPTPRNTTFPPNDCAAPPAPPIAIDQIQGGGATSARAGQVVTTQGVVTARRFNNGFFLQTPDDSADNDGDPGTSEGIFVFTGGAPPASATVGSFVQVRGTVQEFSPPSDPGSAPLTEISGSPIVTVLSTGHPLPAPIVITAADTNPAGPADALERYEGMRVRVESLTVVSPTDGNVNETNATATSNGLFYAVITGVPRPFREPGVPVGDTLPPGSPCCLPRFDGNPERLRVDSDGQVGSPRLEVTSGAVLSGVVGPLDFAFRTYTLLPDPPPGGPIVTGNVTAGAVRPPAADELTVASANLQRFFDTEANSSAPVLTAAAFAARLAKASKMIRDVMRSPDIIGVEEVENVSALQTLAQAVNADAIAAGQPDPQYQAFLEEGNDVGGIDTGFLVKAARVQVVDVVQEGKDTLFPLDGSLLNDRPPLILRARVMGPGGRLHPVTVIVNHLRSLSGVDDPADGDRVRRKRRAQAEYLAALIQDRQSADPTEAIVSVGDYNAFAFNDGLVDSIGTIKGTPTAANEVVLASGDLVDPDLVNLVDLAPADQRYSFSFDGNAQELDHVLVTANLVPRLRGLEYARNNTDFPETYRNDATRPERVSDHDPVVAYFSLPANRPPVANAGGDRRVSADAACRAAVTLDGSASSDPDGDALTYTWTGPFGTINGVTAAVTLSPGAHAVTLTVDDGHGGAASTSITVTVVDDRPPVITIRGANPFVLELGRKFVDPGATAVDACSGAGTITRMGTVNTRVAGTYTLTYAAQDASGNWAAETRTVKVVDRQPPCIQRLRATPDTLWPPDHRLVPVTVKVTATDDAGAPSCRITRVTSNEPVSGRHAGHTTPDWIVTGDLTLKLRAERLDSRIYSIRVTCGDLSGNTTSATTKVRVPHNRPRH